MVGRTTFRYDLKESFSSILKITSSINILVAVQDGRFSALNKTDDATLYEVDNLLHFSRKYNLNMVAK